MKLSRLGLLAIVLAFVATAAFGADQKAQSLYKSKCQACHGADGKATAMGKKLGARDFQDPDVASMSEGALAKVTKDGKVKLPTCKGKLTAKQVCALVKDINQKR